MSVKPLSSSIVTDALRDNRGATAMVFAVCAVTLVTFIGLAVQSGMWYVSKRNAQNVADAAAIAGAMSIFWSDYPNTCSSTTSAYVPQIAANLGASYVATANGFNVPHLNTYNPPISGNAINNYCAQQVSISQTQPPIFAAIIGHTTNISISVTATALLSKMGNACVLGLGDGLSIGSNVTADTGCMPSSQASGAAAIDVYGNGSVTAKGLYSQGGCTTCSGLNLTEAALSYQNLPSANPYTAVDSAAAGLSASPPCPPSQPTYTPGATVTLFPTYGNYGWYTGYAVCNRTLKVRTGDTVRLTPGSYIFYNAGIDAQGGTIECWDPSTSAVCASPWGVAIVFIGTAPNGQAVNIGGTATVILQPPEFYAWADAADGVVLYQPASAIGSVSITGNGNVNIIGGMYFPGSDVVFRGNASSTTCTILVAKGIDTSNSYFNSSGCSPYGTKIPTVWAVRLWQ